MLLGLLCQVLPSKGGKTSEGLAKQILSVGLLILITTGCWALQQPVAKLLLIISAAVMLIIGSISDNKYFAAIDKLLNESDTYKEL